MRRRALAVALTVGAVAFGVTSTASADHSRYGPYTGPGAEKACKVDQMTYRGASKCAEDPPGSGRWFFDAPTQPDNPYK